jgi:phenylacetate-CoA ligase
MTMYPEISEAERFPLLTPAGRTLLHAMRQHPHAPIWNWPNGEQLNAAGLEQVERFTADLAKGEAFGPDQPPAWLPEFVAFCLAEVPFYRRRSPPGASLSAIPTCSRADLAPRVWDFVPDSQPLDELIVFSSSGTTGYQTRTPAHPASAASGLPLIEQAVAASGLHFPRGPEQMALTNIAAYPGAYTTAIVVAWLQEAGCIRVNLNSTAWRQAADCPAFLDRFWSPVMLGDPQAFLELEKIGIERQPQVLVSSIFELSDALAAQFAARYGCPVVDLYALTEAGIVAAKTHGGTEPHTNPKRQRGTNTNPKRQRGTNTNPKRQRGTSGHAILPHDLYVEILDEHDQPCPSGTRGEITLTGGRNPFLPLLRYRTGDYAALAWEEGRPTLVGLEGRAPVSFAVGDRVIHSMEVTRLLRTFPLAQYQLHQDEDGGFRFGYRGGASEVELHEALHALLGQPKQLTLEELPPATAGRRKTVVYRSLHPAAGCH